MNKFVANFGQVLLLLIHVGDVVAIAVGILQDLPTFRNFMHRFIEKL